MNELNILNENTALIEIKQKLFDIENELKEENPNISSLLRYIHTALRKDPEIVTLLNETEITAIVTTLKLQAGEMLAVKATKSRAPKKTLTLDDLL